MTSDIQGLSSVAMEADQRMRALLDQHGGRLPRRPLVYLSGPISAKTMWAVAEHVHVAERAFVACCEADIASICVHSMGRNCGDALDHAGWMAHDLEILQRCDAVLMVGEWQQSVGARMELWLASRLQIPVFFDVEALKQWAGSAGVVAAGDVWSPVEALEMVLENAVESEDCDGAPCWHFDFGRNVRRLLEKAVQQARGVIA